MIRKTVIGVSAPREFEERSRLFRTLEVAFPVVFRCFQDELPEGLEGAIFLTENPQAVEKCVERGIRVFSAPDATTPGAPLASHQEIAFSREPALDGRLQGQSLVDESLPDRPPLQLKVGDRVLASCGDSPLWIQRQLGRSLCDILPFSPEEIGEQEVLRHHLQGNRFIRLLPLLHFLRELTVESDWTPPPLRANIHIDDPNLHRPTYGFVNFKQLAAHARQHRYHISMATIPLDGWFAHPEAVKVFRENRDHLSLLMHGNNHTHRELGRPMSEQEAIALFSQALRRVASFERRYGIPVSRIQIPPGEHLCSEEVLRAMLKVGIEGCSNSRSYMWRCKCRLENVPTDESLACFWPAEMLVGGLPVFRRVALDHALAKPWQKGEVVLSAFLNQPIVLVAGHHTDLRAGLDALEAGAQWINSLGPVDWQSMGGISQSNYATRLEGSQLGIRLFSRRIRIQIPEGVEKIQIERTPVHGVDEGDFVISSHAREHHPPQGYAILENCQTYRGNGSVDFALQHPAYQDPNQIARPPRRIWPLFRRVLTEMGDRFVDSRIP